MMGLREVFEAFVMSAPLGLVKPDERIFRAALENMGLPAARVLFVDDPVENVRGALGMPGVVLVRNAQPLANDFYWIADLLELKRNFW